MNRIPVPSVGRVVFYYALGSVGGKFPQGEPRAAIITVVETEGTPESAVTLTIFNPTGFYVGCRAEYGPEKAGCWGWPPRVPDIEVF